MKLTRVQTAYHGEACSLLSLQRTLTDYEVDFCYRNWLPSATNNIAVSKAFFTPMDLASQLHLWLPTDSRENVRIVDLAAGIGMLTHSYREASLDRNKIESVCIELCQEFIDVGKRLLPDVRWVHGSIFDKEVWQDLGFFDASVLNPPFGSYSIDCDWINYKKGRVELKAVEVAYRFSRNGVAILPPSSAKWICSDGNKRAVGNYDKFRKYNPHIEFTGSSIDVNQFESFTHTKIKCEIVPFGDDDDNEYTSKDIGFGIEESGSILGKEAIPESSQLEIF